MINILINPVIREQPNIGSSWMIVLFAVCLLAIMSVRIVYPRRIGLLFKTFINFRSLKQQIRDENIFDRLPSLLTLLLFFISSALFLYEVDVYFKLHVFYDLMGLSLLMMYLLSVFIIYFIRLIIVEILKHVFIPFATIESYFYTTLQFNKVLGIFLLVICFVIAFVHKTYVLPILWLGFIISVSCYIFRIIRGFQIGFQNSISFSYLFLYLCGLEIAPALLIAKLLIAKL
jgi:hypothetical protein